MRRSCVVLGGGGFIGAAIVEQLLDAGWRVRVFERAARQSAHGLIRADCVEWVQGDFQNKADLLAALEGMDAVVHLVSSMLPQASNQDPLRDVQTNLMASIGLLDAMVQAKVGTIVFASSGGTVYGVPQSVPITEDHPTDPLVSYGICKLAIEKYLGLYARQHAIRPVILRVANPYGEHQRIETAQGAVAAFIHSAIRDEQVQIWGDGSVTRDYIHVADVAAAFVRALSYKGEKTVFNIGSGAGTSLNQLLALLEGIAGRPIRRVYNPGRSFDVPVNVLDNTLARAALHWEPSRTLEEGLRSTFNHVYSHWHP